jgi:hypothetical protein
MCEKDKNEKEKSEKDEKEITEKFKTMHSCDFQSYTAQGSTYYKCRCGKIKMVKNRFM